MFRSHSKREFAAWTVIGCLVAFGLGAVLVKRFRPVGPMEFQELPASQPVPPATPPAYRTNPVPESVRGPLDAPPNLPNRAPTDQPAQVSNLQPGTGNPESTAQVQPGTTPPKPPGKKKAPPELASVSLNTGELADLEKLPGVGPGIAQRIIDYRTEHGTFQSLDELRNVKGIGEKRFAKLEPYLRL